MTPRPRLTRTTRTLIALLSITASSLTACSDSANPTAPVSRQANTVSERDEEGIFHRFVSMGTSISMGWQSEGVFAGSQQQAWTSQLATLASRSQSMPLVGSPGCRSPFTAPLASGKRLSGEGAATDPGLLSCASNEDGVTLPAQSVAIAAASTYDAMHATPETKAGDASYGRLYTRVLPPNTTQLQAALDQKPKFISVEFGGNEVLNARSGVAIVGATLTPLSTWKPQYTALTDAVANDVKRGILVGLLNDVGDFPSFRRGKEIWADRGVMAAAFNIAVNADCDASENLIFVPVRIPTAVATGAAYRARGLGQAPFSCADGGYGRQDFVLTPAEANIVNELLAAMNAHISAAAETHGFAYMALEELYGRADLKPTYSTIALMTSQTPYGFAISLDGIHPSNAGHAILATAAARAINARYGTTIPETPAMIALR